VILAIFTALAGINIRGATPGVLVIEAVTIAKLVPLGLIVLAGLPLLAKGHPFDIPAPGLAPLGRAAIVLIYAFLGTEVALAPSGEIADPWRSVPRAVYGALAIVTLLYLAIQSVALAAVGPALATYSVAPLAETASRLLGPVGRLFVLGGTVVSMFGYVSGDMLSSPRAVYAFARDGLLPARLADIHPRFRTPHVAIAVYAAVVAGLAITSSFERLAVLANVTTLSLYLMCTAAAWKLQRDDVRQGGGEPFVMPAGPVVPVAAASVIVWLLSNATRREFTVLALVGAIASTCYFIRRAGATR
jgi:amino acid transporter